MGSVCGGGALLGDLIGVIRSMEREVLSLSLSLAILMAIFQVNPG